MSSEVLKLYLSAIDKERFGIQTAKALDVTLDTLPAVMDFCQAQGVALLITRCLTSELQAAQAMEQEGFSLMDTLVYHTRSLAKTPIPPDTGQTLIRPVRSGEEGDVRNVAANAFHGYFGHYHADARLDRAKCDEVYMDWAFRSCVSRKVVDQVLVAEVDGVIAGFMTVRLNSSEESEAVVGGVATWAQARGIYRSLLIHVMEWSLSQGATRVLVSTQITNTAVQRVWARLGFEPTYAYYTFHKWFDRP